MGKGIHMYEALVPFAAKSTPARVCFLSAPELCGCICMRILKKHSFFILKNKILHMLCVDMC